MGDSGPSRAGSLHLIGGALCLDFANTASGRATEAAQEHLRSYDDLLIWSVHGGDLSAAGREALARAAVGTPDAARRVLKRALALREAVRGVVLALSRGVPADPGDVAVVRNEAAAAVVGAELVRNGGAHWRWPDDTRNLARPLWPVAHSAFALIEEADPRRLKLCPGADCGWIFLDRSKNNSRRWCDMRVCGNRAKARRFYRRSGA